MCSEFLMLKFFEEEKYMMKLCKVSIMIGK